MVYWWFVFKEWNGKYYVGYAIAIPFEVIEVAPLPEGTLALQGELYAYFSLYFSQEKKCNSRYAFGVVHDFGKLWEQHDFLTSSRNKILNGPYIQ